MLDIKLPLQKDSSNYKNYIKLKTVGMKCLNLYCNNYYDDIINNHDEFIPIVWNLLSFAKTDITYSKLVKQLLDYYKILFQYNRAKGFDDTSIQHLINNLVIPNMQLTLKELEDYEDNAINFLKIELEEVDMDSSKNNK